VWSAPWVRDGIEIESPEETEMHRHAKFILIAVLAFGCSAKTLPTEAPLSVSPLQFGRGEVRVPDQVLIITDASGTMYEHETFPRAKALTRTFVAAMPAADAPAARAGGYEAGLTAFGGNERIIAPLTRFNRAALASTADNLRLLGEVGGFGGRTPYHAVLRESRKTLAGKPGVGALVIFSDGLPDDEGDALRAGRALVASRDGRICIHTVHIGDDPQGSAFLAKLAKLSGCGTSREAGSIRDPSAFMQFTHDVFAGAGRAPAPAPDVCSGVIRLRGVEFEFDSDRLTGASSVVLDAAADGLRGCPNIQVRVEGHTDSVGSDAYNQGLGLRRANAVKGYLVGAGIAERRLSVRSFGESRPIASNETDEGRALNRRVELHTE